MTPFVQFRLWWNRSASGDKLAATLATIVVVALVAWVLVPSGEDDSDLTAVQTDPAATAVGEAGGAGTETTVDTSTGASVDPGAPGATVPGAATPGGGSGTSSGSGAQGGGSGLAANCPPTPTSGGQGVTDKTILVDFALLELGGPIGNDTVGAATADETEQLLETLIADLNAKGGVACRQLTAKYYRLNPISPDNGRSGCLRMLQDRPAVVIDIGGLVYGNAYNCIPQQKVPAITIFNILPSEAKKFFPYLASPSGDLVTATRNAAHGFNERGFFDPAKGFKKLGLLVDQCAPEATDAFEAMLAKLGVTSGQISKYTFACPSNGFASPGDMTQAVAQHRTAGVSHVAVLTGAGSFNTYSEAAERQGYRPKYGATDYNALITTTNGSLKPNRDNFDGALGISTTTIGLNTTPGAQLDPGTKRCQVYMQKAGLPPEDVFKGGGGGGACDVFWVLTAALSRARSLTSVSILPVLFDAGPIQLAYPLHDVTFKAPGKLYGGDFWSVIEWRKQCGGCWQIIEPKRPAI